MISRRELLRSAASASIAMPFVSAGTFAQDAWPSREIHSICGYPPGSGADIIVRYYSRRIETALGKTVVVDNKVGANSMIATEHVARSKPDGYTLFVAAGSSFLAAAASLYKKLAFDPINDFEHVTTIFKIPFVLVVAGDSPYKTLADLTNDLKQKGSKGFYGSFANTGVVSSELYKAHFKLDTVQVNYKETNSIYTDLWGKHLQFAHVDPVSASGHLKSGKIRALATTTAERVKALPDIPSAKEAGIMNTDLTAWWSVHMPKGTPKPILDRLETEFNKIAVDEETTKFLSRLGSDPFPGNSGMLKELLVKEAKAWAEYVKIAKIEPI